MALTGKHREGSCDLDGVFKQDAEESRRTENLKRAFQTSEQLMKEEGTSFIISCINLKCKVTKTPN